MPQNDVRSVRSSGHRLINQTHSEAQPIIQSSGYPITQSLRRNVHYAATETTIFQLSDQKFEHMMIIDDKSSKELEHTRKMCK